MKKLERSGPSNWRALSHVAACALAVGGGDLARADVLYDTTDMSESGAWNTSYTTFIGGAKFFGGDIDVQAADDFALDGTYAITSVTADYGTNFGLPPVDGVLVEIFEDMGGFPSEVPIAQVFSVKFAATPIDIQHPVIIGLRLTVDLSNEDIELVPGTWWVSITPVDTAPLGGDTYNQLASTAGIFGNNTHLRNGGLDHGNGLPGVFGVVDWTLAGLIAGHDDAELAMKIEGTPVKPECPWDLDDNGVVGASDLLSLLAQWGTDPGGPPDFDGNRNVGASDLLALLANWGSCP